ncbi:MAG: group II intron maturase-specific domain-containing protein, partial [Chloroflexota bacterium]
GVMDGGLFAETREGTPQGGIVSPLLANIYLHELDMWWWNKYGGLHRNEKQKRRYRKQGNAILVRYADDFIMLWNGTHEGALQLRDEIKAFLWEELHLELSEEKTHVTHVMDGFDFLGFHLQYRTRKGHRPMLLVTPKRDNIERFKAKVKRLTRRSSVLVPVDLRFQQLNSLIRGWGNYYRYANFTHDAKKLDWWISNRVLIWLQAKHKGQGTRAILEQYLVRETRKQYDRKNFAAKDGKGKLRFIARLQDIPILKYRFRKRPNPYLTAVGFVPPAEAERPFGDAVPANIGEQRTQWLETRQQAVERDEYRCSICGKDIDTTQLHGHHIEARRDGGKDELANVTTLCEDCHKKRTTYGQKRKR